MATERKEMTKTPKHKKRYETAALYMTIFLRHNLSIYISLCADLIIFLSGNLSM